MDIYFRHIETKDKLEILTMMKEFYESNAVSTNGSPQIFENDFNNCINNSPYLEGFVFCSGDNILGYAMLAKTFSTEFGKPCIWFEDLYLKKEYRGKGIIKNFFKHIENSYKGSILRLEVESNNFHAIHVYEKSGFKELPYTEMKKEN